jgi:hypothetical protein
VRSHRMRMLLAGSLILTPGLAVGPAAAQAAAKPTPTATAPGTVTRDPAPQQRTVEMSKDKPLLGWSSWSMESSSYPGLNPKGSQSWLNETNLFAQIPAFVKTLEPAGYTNMNIDAGWSADYDWTFHFDANGREQADPERFPHGMKYVADKLHANGIKAGIYLPVGLERPAYDRDGGRSPIAGAPGCTLADIVYPDLRTTNGWDSSYKIDFGKPCAAKFIDSYAQLIADWGFDFLKVDGVGPGSFKTGDNYDNIADVRAWRAAIDRTGRPIRLELSWSLDRNHAADWKANGNGWRIDTDVECYCSTLVTWNNSVKIRWDDVPAWTPWAGPGGWNDLDSLDVGNGAMDGLTPDERQSYMTLWAISAAPLYTGDDLTKLDAYGKSLLTNRAVLAIDQQGIPARPVTPSGTAQVWGLRNTDGSSTVALFNLGSFPAQVHADWTSFGFDGRAEVRDVWSGKDLGAHDGGIAATLPAHGSRLFRVSPPRGGTAVTTYPAEARANILVPGAAVAACPNCAGGSKVGNLYNGGAVQFAGVKVKKAGTYAVNLRYVSGDPRSATVSANGQDPRTIAFPASGGWDLPATATVPLHLHAGLNTIEIDSSAVTYSPDMDAIQVPVRPVE